MNLAKSSIQTFAAHILIFMQALIIMPLIVKVSGIEVYGYYTLLISLLNIVYGISSFGYGYKAMRYLPIAETKKQKSSLFMPQFYFQIISIVVLSIIMLVGFFYLKNYQLISIGQVSILLIPLYLCMQVLHGQSATYLRYTNKIGFMNIITVLTPYLFIFFTLLTYNLFEKLKINWIISSNILSMAIISAAVFLIIRKELNIRIQCPNIISFKEDILLGLPLMCAFLVETIIIIGDRYVLAYFMSLKDVGGYASAYMIGGLAIIVVKVFGVILPPLLSKELDLGSMKKCTEIIGVALKVFLITSIPFTFGSVIFGKEILQLMTDKETANAAWVVIPIISFATIFLGINIILSSVLFVQKKTRVMFKINLIIAIFNILLNLVLIGLFKNIESAAISTAFSYGLGCVLMQRNVEKKWFIALKIKTVLYIVCLSLVMFFIIILARNIIYFENIILNISFGIFVGGFCYCYLLLRYKYFFINDFDSIKKLILNKT